MNLFKNLKITWLSAKKVRSISFGEITNHGMVDTKTLKPKLGGLFDPKIFGTSFNLECYCGKYKGRSNLGHKCERCDVEITEKRIQRWRSGHIEFAYPVTDILKYKNLSSLISKIIGIPSGDIEDVIYLNSYVVLNSGNSKIVKKNDIFKKTIKLELIKKILEEYIEDEEKKRENIDEKTLTKAKGHLKSISNIDEGSLFFFEDYLPFLEKNLGIIIGTGSETFLKLLQNVDLEEFLSSLTINTKTKLSQNIKLIKFCKNMIKNKIKIEWLVMHNILVIPAGLRPITKLKKEDSIGTGKETLATTQINTLYRKVILANENIKYYIQSENREYFGEIIINSAKRRLQKSVDQLMQGSFMKSGEIKGLLQQISGKEGILRHYCLGKRTDYSSRAVISTSTDIKFNEMKVPVQIAIITFKPLIIQSLLNKKIAFTVREAEEIIDKELSGVEDERLEERIVFKELNEICLKYPLLFNRPPSLHRLSIQAAFPRLTIGKTIDIHPLITTPYNADCDGDVISAMNVFTTEEIYEAKKRMLTTNQIIDPKNGNVITIPKQDIVLGIYWLTKEKKPKNIKIYDNFSSTIAICNI